MYIVLQDLPALGAEVMCRTFVRNLKNLFHRVEVKDETAATEEDDEECASHPSTTKVLSSSNTSYP